MVLTQMRQELQVKHQNPNQKLPLGSLLTKLHLNPWQCLPTSMVDAEKFTNAAGQKITVFTADHQLCSGVLDIMRANHDHWMFFVSRLGGMHWLMNFIGSVGALMANIGSRQILRSAFAGSDKILLGKKFPMNLRAFRFVVTEVLR